MEEDRLQGSQSSLPSCVQTPALQGAMARWGGAWDPAIRLLLGNLSLPIAIAIKSTTVVQTGIPAFLHFLSYKETRLESLPKACLRDGVQVKERDDRNVSTIEREGEHVLT